jgi:hypothetical protein
MVAAFDGDIDAIDPLGDRLQHLPSFAGLRLLELRNNDRALLATDLEQCSTMPTGQVIQALG